MISDNKSPSINQLKYFVAVAKQLSFRRAAQSLGVSQPTLTIQVQSLEKNLKLSLFERNRSGTLLTPQGHALLVHAEAILRATQRFNDSARELIDGTTTTYRLGIPPTLGPYLLPFVLPELHRRFSQLKFYVREGSTQQLEEGLLSGDYDLIISPSTRESSQLIVSELFTEPLKLVMPSDHALAGQEFVNPSDIQGEKVLTLEDSHHFHHQVQTICAQIGAHLHRDYEGTSLDTLRQMVVMGVGVSFLPGLYIHSELHRPDELHVCELLDTPITRLHHLIWRNTAPGRVFFRELGQLFRDIIEEKLANAVTVSKESIR
ncbi:hydrogen peroxide-inducible genes activator [Aliiglaciecola lipolytica]|uniref:LysR family transcriptional regulator, hydrogen peroxide-inducible genes activator n=1 Tax=Aliiglaciecola lipolytica E3 TaxID=1127673 RepID=K6WXS5_9ALTE|nr:hydrogen peroxide-inducible genes activator [Aliiglaciecola lipolytica]GAC13274.1 LysR family transcriptional regulator, hydrogen peroxide-inducible genes activator [Aliiglaciecola lipolytica E3]